MLFVDANQLRSVDMKSNCQNLRILLAIKGNNDNERQQEMRVMKVQNPFQSTESSLAANKQVPVSLFTKE